MVIGNSVGGPWVAPQPNHNELRTPHLRPNLNPHASLSSPRPFAKMTSFMNKDPITKDLTYTAFSRQVYFSSTNSIDPK